MEKICHPRQEMTQLPQVSRIENGKPDFSPLFPKIKLLNYSTFLQWCNSNEQILCLP